MDEELQRAASGRVDDLVAIVTGGGTTDIEEPVTFGYAIASALAAGGAHVYVLDRDPDAAERTVQRIRARGHVAHSLVADVSSDESCRQAVGHVVNTHDRVDVLVNNAAVIGRGWHYDDPDEAYLGTLDVNYLGAVRMVRACVSHLTTRASIINIASTSTDHDFGMLDYSASKGALRSLTFAQSVQLGPLGIRVNAISPGTMWAQIGQRKLIQAGASAQVIAAQKRLRAEAVPLRRDGSGWDIAMAALFLASWESQWISGQDLVVDAALGRVGIVTG